MFAILSLLKIEMRNFMYMKRLMIILFMASTFIFLQACGKSDADNLIGTWQMMNDEQAGAVIDFTEDTAIAYDLKGEAHPVPYKFIETNDNHWMIYVIEPSNNKEDLFFQGYFENKNTAIYHDFLDKEDDEQQKVEMHRIKDIEKALSVAREQKEKEKKKKEKENKKIQEEMEKQEEKERKEQVAQEEQKELEKKEQIAREQEEKEKQNDRSSAATDPQTLNTLTQRATDLQKRMVAERNKAYPNSQAPVGFTGQYLNDWDQLLNDIWQEIRTTLPKDQFQPLLEEQREWVAIKESVTESANSPDSSSIQRAGANDEVTQMIEARVFKLLQYV